MVSSRITFDLRADDIIIACRTVSKILRDLVLYRRRFIDPSGEHTVNHRLSSRNDQARWSTSISRKSEESPTVAGTPTDRANQTTGAENEGQAGTHRLRLTCFIAANARLVYTEARDNETAVTAIDFMNNARMFFAANGITRIERVITDNGSCYRAADFTVSLCEARHCRTKPYTPKHNGEVERCNRILADELLYSRERHRRIAVEVWNVHTITTDRIQHAEHGRRRVPLTPRY